MVYKIFRRRVQIKSPKLCATEMVEIVRTHRVLSSFKQHCWGAKVFSMAVCKYPLY